MGRVYRAEQAPLGRLCAIKVVNAGFGGVDPEFHKRFFLEASISSKLTHPNTVTVFDYGKTDDDIYYMAMELLEGRTLHRALREDGPFSEERTVHIARQISRSVREAHAHGVIHRDLKPANVFLVTHGDERDFVKVLDFGLVKNVDERPEEQLTQTGLFMGSPKYMAPEQIEGTKVDGRTDMYSLGVMMYEMLTGRVPFERASSVNTLMAHVHEPVPPMRVTNPHVVVSGAMEAVVMRCMAKQVDERFASIDELLNTFKALDTSGGSGPYESRSSWLAGRSPSRHPSQADANAISSVHVRTETQALARASMPSAPAWQAPGATERAQDGSGPVAANDASAPYVTRRAGPSRGAIAALALVAIGIGGGLGYLAYWLSTHRGATSPTVAEPSPSAPTSAQMAPRAQGGSNQAPSTSPPQTTPNNATANVTVQLSSEPQGVRVTEGNAVLCAATPCNIQVSPGDEKRVRSLTFSKMGYGTEQRQTSFEAPVQVFLAPARGGHASATASTPKPSAGAAAAPVESSPAGFKKTPY